MVIVRRRRRKRRRRRRRKKRRLDFHSAKISEVTFKLWSDRGDKHIKAMG